MKIIGYKIQRKIGEGAMASVFLAVQETLGRQVALKVLTPDLVCQPGFTDRFLNEGRIVAHLNHPRIVSVYDLGVNPPNYYMAMELLSGGTLQEKIKKGMTPYQSVQCIKQICGALNFAHMNGVIHRDIKSQNIMFRDSDVPVLTDFGIARLIDGDLSLTIPGRTVGSPLYMSPEQISGRKIDSRSDLYSVGILFYEMLTTHLPYRSNEFMAVALMHKTAPVPVLPGQLSVFQPVLERLLAKDPDGRYATAQNLIEALLEIESSDTLPMQVSNPSEADIHTGGSAPAAGRLDLVAASRESLSGEETQPAFKPSLGTDDKGSRTKKVDDALHKRDISRLKETADSLAPPKRGRLRKMILAVALGGMILVLGLFAADTLDFELFEASEGLTINTASVTKLGDALHPVPTPEPMMVPSHHLSPEGSQQDESGLHTEMPINEQNVAGSKIDILLDRAKAQLANNRLTSPEGDNCYETYRQILSLDPSGQTAKSLLNKIGQAYGRLARSAKGEGRFQDGLVYAGKGIELLPTDSKLKAIQLELRAGITEQNRRAQEQARQSEQLEQLRAAEQAAAEKRLKVEQELRLLRQQEAERELLKKQNAEQEKAEQSKDVIIVQPEMEKEKSKRRNRLFGTF